MFVVKFKIYSSKNANKTKVNSKKRAVLGQTQ